MSFDGPADEGHGRRVLVIGRTGRVARALARQTWPAGVRIQFAGRGHLDLLEPGRLLERISDLAPDIIINTSAYTDVDGAESDREAAMALNAVAPAHLAQCAKMIGADLFHLSTDFVFGTGSGPRKENVPTDPLSHYGVSKREGEVQVLAAHPGATIVRTAWLFDGFSPNFVTTLLALADRPLLKVVADQFGSPTHTDHLAQALIQLIHLPTRDRPGVLHIVNEGRASRLDQARHLFAALGSDRSVPTLEPIEAREWPTPATRPSDSQLDTGLWQQLGFAPLPSWQEAVSLAVRQWLDAKGVRVL